MNPTPRTDDFYANPPENEAAYEFARQLESELAILAQWKKEHLTVESWWQEIDAFVRNHADVQVGDAVAHNALRWLRERDTLIAERDALKLTIDSAHSRLDDTGLLGMRGTAHRGLLTRSEMLLGRMEALRKENDRLQRGYVRSDDIRAQLENANAEITSVRRQLMSLQELLDQARKERDEARYIRNQQRIYE